MLCQGCSWHMGIPLRKPNVSLQQHIQTGLAHIPGCWACNCGSPSQQIIALLLLSVAGQIFLQHYSSTGPRAWLSGREDVAKCCWERWVINIDGIWGNGRNKIWLLVACVWAHAQIMVNKYTPTIAFALAPFSWELSFPHYWNAPCI